ncbi:hypothetical protein POTOM_009096 [Populus tomentosa]|uniref:Tetraspanin family protein n=1 Tax=Populus tomentosa TaxID=118781 RepID=A0A8X8AFE2_POPTO|nr:hypothetical protein POTOM_009096 [Populus tomentosa]
MGVGVILCCITFIGCIAAESINGCCLCFYTILKIVFILLEAALVAFIAIDRRWEKDLPFDPTGELQSLRNFVEENVDICKWVGITVLIIQALALLLAMILRAMVSTRRNEFGEDDFENVRGRTREPLLNQSGQTFSPGTHSDIWTSRMREKVLRSSRARRFVLIGENILRKKCFGGSEGLRKSLSVDFIVSTSISEIRATDAPLSAS